MERKQETARVLSSTESSVGSIARKLQAWTLPWTQLEQSSVVPVWLDFQQLLQLLQIVLVEMLRLVAAVARHKPSPNECQSSYGYSTIEYAACTACSMWILYQDPHGFPIIAFNILWHSVETHWGPSTRVAFEPILSLNHWLLVWSSWMCSRSDAE